jgi:hypothetical protein
MLKILTTSLFLLSNFAGASDIYLTTENRTYDVPPSTSTISASTISDEAMKTCVELYNETRWLEEKIDNTSVDEYSQRSVDAYNAMISNYGRMTDRFNQECAGKSSESAAKAARALNSNN